MDSALLAGDTALSPRELMASPAWHKDIHFQLHSLTLQLENRVILAALDWGWEWGVGVGCERVGRGPGAQWEAPAPLVHRIAISGHSQWVALDVSPLPL